MPTDIVYSVFGLIFTIKIKAEQGSNSGVAATSMELILNAPMGTDGGNKLLSTRN
jgi:hypothetical protein